MPKRRKADCRAAGRRDPGWVGVGEWSVGLPGAVSELVRAGNEEVGGWELEAAMNGKSLS